MMTPDTKPKRIVSQAPLKPTVCSTGCGAPLFYRTKPTVFCDPCRLEAKRARARVAMEKQRRKKGIVRVDGVVIACEDCGASITLKRNAAARRCKACSDAKALDRARRVSRARKGVPGAYKANGIWATKKRHTSARHAINFRFRAAIRRELAGTKQGRKWEALVGYTLSELMQHLERQFTKGMTWDNRGAWHIDHIIPLSSFKYESPDDPDFKAAWALSNLRPLWAKENLSKNAKRTHLL